MEQLDITYLTRLLKNRVPRSIEPMNKFAVLLPLIWEKGEWRLIFEKRAKDLNSQPGEISFPGGGLESDESFLEAAVRETMEELNLEKDNIEVIGELDYLISYAALEIHCFLGTISGIDVDKIEPNPAEVDHIFTVPLGYFLENQPKEYYLDLVTRYNEEFPYNLIPKGKDYDFRPVRRNIYFYSYKDYIIWGYTASMIKNLVDIIKGKK